MKHIFDPSFKYTPAVATDIRKTFERIKKEKLHADATKDPLFVLNTQFVQLSGRNLSLVQGDLGDGTTVTARSRNRASGG